MLSAQGRRKRGTSPWPWSRHASRGRSTPCASQSEDTTSPSSISAQTAQPELNLEGTSDKSKTEGRHEHRDPQVHVVEDAGAQGTAPRQRGPRRAAGAWGAFCCEDRVGTLGDIRGESAETLPTCFRPKFLTFAAAAAKADPAASRKRAQKRSRAQG